MAKVLSPLHSSAASGKFGDIVYKHNRYGAYATPYMPPTGALSMQQQSWQDSFAYCLNYYDVTGIITDEKKERWNSFASNNYLTDRLGRQYRITGKQWFLRLNITHYAAGFSIRKDPPASAACTYLPTVTCFIYDAYLYATIVPFPTDERVVYFKIMHDVSKSRKFMSPGVTTPYFCTYASSDPPAIDGMFNVNTSKRILIKYKSLDDMSRPSSWQTTWIDDYEWMVP